MTNKTKTKNKKTNKNKKQKQKKKGGGGGGGGDNEQVDVKMRIICLIKVYQVLEHSLAGYSDFQTLVLGVMKENGRKIGVNRKIRNTCKEEYELKEESLLESCAQ